MSIQEIEAAQLEVNAASDAVIVARSNIPAPVNQQVTYENFKRELNARYPSPQVVANAMRQAANFPMGLFDEEYEPIWQWGQRWFYRSMDAVRKLEERRDHLPPTEDPATRAVYQLRVAMEYYMSRIFRLYMEKVRYRYAQNGHEVPRTLSRVQRMRAGGLDLPTTRESQVRKRAKLSVGCRN